MSALITALIPVFEVKPDVIGDDDQVILSLPYEVFEHLAHTFAPFLPGGSEKFAAYRIWEKNHG